MFPLWRIAYVRAALRQGPWQNHARGLASWLVCVAAPAVLVGVVVSGSVPEGLVIAVWAVLAVGVVLVASGLWGWRLSGLIDKDLEARYPTLGEVESARLRIRPPVRRDAVALAETIDTEMLTGNGWTERMTRDLVKGVGAGHPIPGFLVFEGCADGVLVGGATVQPGADASARTLGWWIGPRHRRAGYASEAVTALVEAIHAAGFATVEIGTTESNLAVRRICDRIGATEKDRRAQTLPDGSVVPSIWYEHRQATADKP